jgi:DivIVA domain-containing protein
MPLTPDDVRNKRFTPVRLREGYDMAEVDAFLDEVEAELIRLGEEGSTSAAESDDETSAFAGYIAPESASDAVAAPSAADISAASAAASSASTDAAPTRAARLLELATRNADELVAEAQAEAEALLADAQARAEKLTAEAKARSEQLEAETARRRQELTGELDRQKSSLSAEIERLRIFEREYRTRLRQYLQDQLGALDGEAAEASALQPGTATQS